MNDSTSHQSAPSVSVPDLGELPTPPAVTAALQRYRQEIKRAAADSLTCMALYGGILRQRYEPPRSDINVLVVLNEVTGDGLARLGPVLHSAWREIRLDPFLLAQSELGRAAVMFPTKMLDICRYHRVLDGADVLKGIEVRHEDLSLRIEQELFNLSLRLRRRFLSIQQDDQAMERALLDIAVPLRINFLALMDLAGMSVPEEERTAAVYAAAAKRFGLDAAALERVSQLRDTGVANGSLRDLLLAVIELVRRASSVVREIGKPT